MEFMPGQRPEWVGRNPGGRVRVEYLASSQQALPQPSPVPWKGSAPQGESQQTGLSWSVLLHRSGGGGDLGSRWRVIDVTPMSFGESEAEWSTMPRSTLQPGARSFVSLGQTAAALGVRFLPSHVKIRSAHLSHQFSTSLPGLGRFRPICTRASRQNIDL